MTLNIKSILYAAGMVLCILSASMVIPMLVDLHYNNPDWQVFGLCSLLTAFFGGIFVLSNKQKKLNFTIKDVFIVTLLSWVLLALFAALPFKLSILEMNTEDAFFEAMSGITTTGATVITDLNAAPPGILIWRAILQWLGGIGILIMTITILPFLRIGGMQLLQGATMSKESARPKLMEQAKNLIGVYISISLLCMSAYTLSGMDLFDAAAHAMSTISSGGFSTHNASFINEGSFSTKSVAIIFMILSGLPFLYFLKIIQRKTSSLRPETEIRTYFYVLIGLSLLMSFALFQMEGQNIFAALHNGIFSIASMMTGTGFASADYALWHAFPVTLLVFTMVIGGCAGSTTCGIKIFRFQIVYKVAKTQIEKLLYPSAVIPVRYQGKAVSDDAIISVLGFFFIFALTFACAVIALMSAGIDLTTAFTAAIACIANVGPGFGEIIGPAGTYAALPQSAKWVLSACMLLGRLEFFTALALLSPYFWR